MRVYYNEFDKKKCAMLWQLMKDGHITKGDIDDRSITNVQPRDVAGYDRAHFFAGIGLWDYSLNLAGWEKDTPVWTGSCPCQPYSTAGRQKAQADDRHLWPQWLRLIKECRPSNVYGEQVANAITFGWLDDVYQGLEAQNYAVGSAVLPACSVGAPHKRDRLWFVANATSARTGENKQGLRKMLNRLCKNTMGNTRLQRQEVCEEQATGSKQPSKSNVGNAEHNGPHRRQVKGSNGETVCYDSQRAYCASQPSRASEPCNVADTISTGLQGHRRSEQEPIQEGRQGTERYPWQAGVWIDCPDGKQRLIEPRIPLLAHGYPERVGLIHAAGDAIVPHVAAKFIQATM